ncbi:trypsin-3 [Amyelois transitella]|uniref:trypsin-3 n=1 Tax=Amyelois transitella TaxID=680683 RepID=UPI00067DF67F|nr:trypsin-3 [Amyelois transitella]
MYVIVTGHSPIILSDKIPVHPELRPVPLGDPLIIDLDSIILAEKVPLDPHDVDTKPVVYEDRVVGGREADIEDHPYQVSFIVNNSYFCGGIIISENYILTAAHCAQNVDPATVVLRAGSSFRKNGTVIPIVEVTPHPEYDNPAFDKDVAVMKTAAPLEFNERVQAIGLPDLEEPVDDSGLVLVSGWGRTQQGAPTIPERLMEAELPVVSHFRCMLVYYSVLTKNMLCAGNFFLGGKGTCQGDSGGPAVQNGKVVGITSFGRGCAQPLSPSVFAKISAPTIRNFITEHTGL